MHGIFEKFPEWEENGLSLRQISVDDTDDLTDLYDFPMNRETVRRMISDYQLCYQQKKEILIGFTWQERLYGVLELYHFNGNTCELGYRTCQHGRRQGITVKAVGFLLKALEYTELHKLYACCDRNHHASQKILEDNGFRMIKTEDQKYWYQRNLTGN